VKSLLKRWLRTGHRPVLARVRRPSPAMIVALIALFASLGGVSYGFATGTIDSREIKNNTVRSGDLRNNDIRTRDLRNNEVRGIDIRNSTVQGRDIALNTVTGTDVKESTLQQVPSAAQADSATSAGSVGGLKLHRIAYSAGEGTAPQTVLSFGGLTITAECATGPSLELVANPAADQPNSHIAATGNGWETAFNDVDFDPGADATATFAGEANSAGTIAFAGSKGSVVTVSGVAVEHTNGVRGTTDDCGFFGTATDG
jgi:hypothetical protein